MGWVKRSGQLRLRHRRGVAASTDSSASAGAVVLSMVMVACEWR
jgi:hypothetical protein